MDLFRKVDTMPRLVREVRAGDELAPVSIGVLARDAGQFVDEGLSIELVSGLADAALRADGWNLIVWLE
jgi:hypothetical protein